MFLKNYILNEGYNKKFFLSGGLKSKIISKNKFYHDLSFGAGTLILGHQSKIYLKAISEIKKNYISSLASPNYQALKFAKLLNKIDEKQKKFIFCNSGTEAVTKSLRIIRAITKKELIISVTGSWHGSVDKLLFQYNTNNEIKALSDGLTKNDKKNIKFIEYNNIKKSKSVLDRYKKKISCIIIEPIQGCLPSYDSLEYLKFLIEYSNDNKIIIIFDEIISGLRVNSSNVQKYIKKHADITILGKCFGGGFPIGIIALSEKITKILESKKLNIFYGGTYSANSLAMHIGYRTTQYILKNKNILKNIEKKSIIFQNELNKYFLQFNIDAKVYRFFSILRIVFSKKNIKDRVQRDFLEKKNYKKINQFKKYLLTKNIYYPSSGVIFFSDKTTFANLKEITLSFKQAAYKILKKI